MPTSKNWETANKNPDFFPFLPPLKSVNIGFILLQVKERGPEEGLPLAPFRFPPRLFKAFEFATN